MAAFAYRCLASYVPKIQLKSPLKLLELYELVERQGIDLAFALRARGKFRAALSANLFFSEPMVALAIRQRPQAQRLITPTDLLAQHEIFLNWGPSFMVWHNCWWIRWAPRHIEVDIVSLMADQLPILSIGHCAQILRTLPLAATRLYYATTDAPPCASARSPTAIHKPKVGKP